MFLANGHQGPKPFLTLTWLSLKADETQECLKMPAVQTKPWLQPGIFCFMYKTRKIMTNVTQLLLISVITYHLVFLYSVVLTWYVVVIHHHTQEYSVVSHSFSSYINLSVKILLALNTVVTKVKYCLSFSDSLSIVVIIIVHSLTFQEFFSFFFPLGDAHLAITRAKCSTIQLCGKDFNFIVKW